MVGAGDAVVVPPKNEVGAVVEDVDPPSSEAEAGADGADPPPKIDVEGVVEPNGTDPKDGAAAPVVVVVAEIADGVLETVPVPPNAGFAGLNAEPNGFDVVVVADDGATPNRLFCWAPLVEVDPKAPADPPNKEVLTGCCEVNGTTAPVFDVRPVAVAGAGVAVPVGSG